MSAHARAFIENPAVRVFVSAASAWEIAIKDKAGKLDAAASLIAQFASAIEEDGFTELAVSVQHAVTAELLETKHGDPFDRVLIAQARIEDLPIVSTDARFDEYHVRRLW